MAPAVLAALALLLTLMVVMVMGVFGAIFGLRPMLSGGYEPSVARAEIPSPYLRLYLDAGRRYGIDPWILAAIGSIETNHGQSTAPGVRSGANACAGPMQFSLIGSPGTLGLLRRRRQRRRQSVPLRPGRRDPRHRRLPCAPQAPPRSSAPPSLPTTTRTGTSPRSSPKPRNTAASPAPAPSSRRARPTVRDILRNERIPVTAPQQSDLRSGLIDARLIATLAGIGRQRGAVVTALRSDHST